MSLLSVTISQKLNSDLTVNLKIDGGSIMSLISNISLVGYWYSGASGVVPILMTKIID